jgi:NitT/TauT family transport system permease protein
LQAAEPSGIALRGFGRGVPAQQAALGIVLLIAWEACGQIYGTTWISRPLLVARQLWSWVLADLHAHVLTTLAEMLAGLCIGTLLGALAGLLLGRSGAAAVILRPVVVALYSVPMVALAPLFIMFFGVGMLPKAILVAIVVFFLIFFNAFAGASSVDQDLVSSLQLMGANKREQFRKVILPGCMTWILGGVKVALPYALVAAVTGEMMASRGGLGSLISSAAAKFDMTSLYSALFILMVFGLIVSETATRLEARLLRWRHASP